MIPTRYATERRTPYAEPAAVRLIVAGPGLPMIASEVIMRGPADPHLMAAARSRIRQRRRDSLDPCKRRDWASTPIVLNDLALDGPIRSGSEQGPSVSSARRSTSPGLSSLTDTTPTP